MRNYYVFITILGIFCLSLVAVCFFIVGNPIEQKAKTYDLRRTSSMKMLSSYVQTYLNKNNSLPVNLSSFPEAYRKDPQSHKDFEYKIISSTTYQLCTTFSTDSTTALSYSASSYSYVDPQTKHKKGYDCFTFYPTPQPAARNYNYNLNSPSPIPSPTPTPFYSVSPSILVPVGNDLSIRIVSLEAKNDILEVTVELKNSGKSSITADLSKLQMNNNDPNSVGSTAAPGYSFNHEVLANSRITTVLKFKRDRKSPYNFNYVDSTRAIRIATAL